METFGARISAALAHAKRDRQELAAHLGVSEQAVGQVINGHTKAMSAYNAARAARFLGVSFYWLCTGQGHIVEPATLPARDWPMRRVTPDDIRTLRDAGKLGEVESFILGLLSGINDNGSKSHAG